MVKIGCVCKYMNFDSDSEKIICGWVIYIVSIFVLRNSGVNIESELDGLWKFGKEYFEYKCWCYVNICCRLSLICCKFFLYMIMVYF